MDTDELLKKRLKELAVQSENQQRYVYTDFLGLGEISVLYELRQDFPCKFHLFGGMEESERKVACFGSREELGYEAEYPVGCIKISPVSLKFAEALSHRDVLGALMNLGIVRGKIGDIHVYENEAYVFCIEDMKSYIAENIDRIRHTNVKCRFISQVPAGIMPVWEERRVQVSAERIDAVIAKMYGLSRSGSGELFRAKRVFINGKSIENTGYILREGDIVTVRRFGKFRFDGVDSYSKKGKKYLIIYEPAGSGKQG